MSTEPNHRAFLLGMSQPESQRLIEEAILAGSIDAQELEQSEEELIDDFVLGRLSAEENRRFESHFLSNAEREQRLKFAKALVRSARGPHNNVATRRRFGFGSLSLWNPSVVLKAALAASVLALAWLSYRNIGLTRELQEVQGKAHQTPTVAQASAPPLQAELSILLPPPDLNLGSGQSRGPEPLPVLRIQPQQRAARIDVELPEGLGGTFRVEVRAWNDLPLWSQNLSINHRTRTGESITIVVPARMLDSENYRIVIDQVLPNGEIQAVDSHMIRVIRR